MSKICIDARFWGIKHTGIGRYTEKLVDNLPKETKDEIVLIVHPELEHEPKLNKFKKYFAKQHPYSLASQLEMVGLLGKIKPDLVHFTHFFVPLLWNGKYVVTIHDLIKHYSAALSATTRNPLIYLIKQLGYRLSVWKAVTFAQTIIVPAKYWQEEISNKYHIGKDKIKVTYEAVDLPKVTSGTTKTNKDKYLLYVGNLYPHKNVSVLVQASKELKIKLKVVCARNVFENKLPQSEYVEYLGRVSDSELVSLYQNALCFVFPSKIEGFGLTGLEAMSQNCPVIAARASCLPEIYEEAALYFDPDSVSELVEKINLLQTDDTLRDSLKSKGKQQVKKYSWARMAQQTWEIYQNVLR